MDPSVTTLLYIGDGDDFVMCSMILKHTDTRFFSYDPSCAAPKMREESAGVNRSLRGRYFCIEKAKEAVRLLPPPRPTLLFLLAWHVGADERNANWTAEDLRTPKADEKNNNRQNFE